MTCHCTPATFPSPECLAHLEQRAAAWDARLREAKIFRDCITMEGFEVSYDIYLNDPETGDAIELDEAQHLQGGTYAIGGTRECWLNVTYNYAPHFYRTMGEKGVRSIYGLTGKQSIPLLEAAIAQLGNDTDEDYWKSTEGNAKKALRDLLSLARLKPVGVWGGD